MAISWNVKITVLNKLEKRASITATRIDDTDSDNSWTFTVFTIIATTTQKLAAADFIWERYQASLTEKAAVAAVIGSLETQAKANLEARE